MDQQTGTPPDLPLSGDGPAPPGPGAILRGKYRLGRLLGAGGMGVVYEAEHLHLGHPVAIKLLAPRAQLTPEISARLVREARTAVTLTSENAVRVLDADTSETGAPFLVMERLLGSDLGELLDERGALPIAEATEYLLQACEAIAEAHKLGIVHRDLKPSNLFLTARADGTPLVKVLDFGVAKLDDKLTDDASLTGTGQVLGSPRYMSPEQVRSEDVGATSDIWALGVVLYRLTTARYPFDGDTATAIAAKIVETTPTPLATLLPGAPPEIGHVVSRCLQKSPTSRFPDVASLALALSPIATPAAALSIQRITRLSRARGGSAAAPAPQASGDATEDYVSDTRAAGEETAPAWTSLPPPPRRRAITATVIALGLLIGAAALVLSRRVETPLPPMTAAAAPSPSPSPSPLAVVPPSRTLEEPVQAASAVAPPSASARATISPPRALVSGAPPEPPPSPRDAGVRQLDPLGDRK